MRVGIRARIILLTIGIGIPLALVGAAALVRMWSTGRTQLDASVRQQAELAATAFERWVDAQRQPLFTTAAAIDGEREPFDGDQLLSYIVKTRPYWIDLTILDAAGRPTLREPDTQNPPTEALLNHLLHETQRLSSWALVTDRTCDESRPTFALGVPTKKGGVVIARIDGAAIKDIFADIQLTGDGVIAVFDSQGQLLYRKTPSRAATPIELTSSPLFAALGNQRATVVELQSPYDKVQRIYGLARSGTTDFVVSVGVPSATLHEPMTRQITRYLLFSFLALAAAMIAAIVIQRSIVRPLDRLRLAALNLGEGNLSARAPVNGGAEIAEVGMAFNRMAEQIKDREERLTELDRLKSEFVGSVSHELRTPLTTIKTLAHVLQRTEPSATERREYLTTISAECDRQIRLVTNLLDLARIESGFHQIELAPFDVADALAASARLERHAAEARGHRLIVRLPEERAFAIANQSALERVLSALIENAIKYTSDSGEIAVGAEVLRDEIAIYVKDNGRGIQSADIPHIFERFYRAAGPSGNSESQPQGVGLGLYLVKGLVDQLKGRITVQSKVNEGTTFTVFLPRSKTGTAIGEGAQPNGIQTVTGR